ncbi:MAG: RluA family pseudouridine synthase [bacterium]|nr:RluA family pseudouridine synthase [bacterium]
MNLQTDDTIDNIVAFTVTKEEDNNRIDKYLSIKQSELTRSYLQKLIKDGLVSVNGKVVKANYKVAENDEIELTIPELKELDVLPEDIPMDIIYEDSDVILINKAKGVVVHPAAGHYSGTLVNGLLYHCKDELSGINGVMRPGIVHRIDMDTTGVIVICKNDKAHNLVAEQLKEHSITRKYVAIVHGNFKDSEGTIEGPIGRHPVDRKKMAINHKNGKHAVTHFKVLENLKNNFTLVECQLETGRTHQIRVHMASIGHPLLGDHVYGPSKSPFKLQGQTLHAKTLGFIHPTTGEYMEFEAPLPDYFEDLLRKLRP